MDRSKNCPIANSRQTWPMLSILRVGARRFTTLVSRQFFVCMLMALLPALVHAANITVCSSGCNQTSVAAAIAAANSGDTITIGAGSYSFNVEIAKNLTLQGNGPGATILDAGKLGTAMKVDAGANVTLQGATVQNGGDDNYPTTSYGIVVYGNLVVSDSLITGNTIGILNWGGVVQVLRSTISNNLAPLSGSGAGILNYSGAMTLFNSTVTGNNGYESGGIAIENGSVALQNSTVSGNISLEVSNIEVRGGILSLSNSTVVDSATPGLFSMAFLPASQVAMNNTILSSTTGAPNCVTDITVLSLGHNLSSDSTCGLGDSTDLNNNPSILLGPLQVNSPGTTATHAPALGSSAIDAGNCSVYGVVEDQRGVTRPQGPACDIGAFEVQVPLANGDAYAATAGKTLVVPAPGLLANDVSPEGYAISVAGVSTTSHGSLTVVQDGALQYLASPGFVGKDTFTYSASDGLHSSIPATVTINVTQANSPPVAQNDSYTMVQGQSFSATAAQGVLANDRDPDGDPITAILLLIPVHGSVKLNSDGSFTYVPNPEFNGVDSFTYEAWDGSAKSSPATVTITVMPNFGTITLQLSTQPQSSLAFGFTGSFGNFTLGGTNPVAKTFRAGAGTWSVTELRPKPWLISNIFCSPVSGSVADLTHNNLQVTVVNGENITCTFVNELPGEIDVHAFNDLNEDGKRESGEPLLHGITVQLYTFPIAPIATAAIDSTGKAVFPALPARPYTVCAVLPAGVTATNPPTIDPAYGKPCFSVNLNPGQKVPLLFGLAK